mmetsp:Transcript_5085/g.12477  ORF Transcript_5085/g.12477 Transcript_5085/m.12477 type:complete len:333 (+) Transcript_5085:48-1046(+)
MSDSEEETVSKSKLVKRHGRELRDLKDKGQREIKKTKNKAEKKELEQKYKDLEQELLAKHRAELEAIGAAPPKEEEKENEEVVDAAAMIMAAEANEGDEFNPGFFAGQKQLSKAAKAKLKKQEKERLRKEEVAKEFENVVPLSTIEKQKMRNQLRSHGLRIHEIPADGNCLFRALEHQMICQKEAAGLDERIPDHSELRDVAATYMLDHADDFRWFVEDEQFQSEDGFKKYCEEKVRGSEWGGELEIQALALSLEKRVQIFQGEGEPLLVRGDQFEGPQQYPELKISYHKFLYASAHYNSLVVGELPPEVDVSAAQGDNKDEGADAAADPAA